MLLALAVAGLLVWGGVAAGPGMWRNILCGSALAIVASIGLWGSALQGDVYRRSAPMNVPFIGKEEEPALARWGTKDGFRPEGAGTDGR
jgi:hypothetical protein